jgi:hypothetical protein
MIPPSGPVIGQHDAVMLPLYRFDGVFLVDLRVLSIRLFFSGGADKIKTPPFFGISFVLFTKRTAFTFLPDFFFILPTLPILCEHLRK